MLWQEFSTLPIDPEWRFSVPSVAEWFLIEQINPPLNAQFLLCQSDGSVIHKPITLNCGRDAEMLQIPVPTPFSAGRKIGIRLENTNFQIRNWSVKISTLIPPNATIRYWLQGSYFDGSTVKGRTTEAPAGQYYDFSAAYGVLTAFKGDLLNTIDGVNYYRYKIRLDPNNAYDFPYVWSETPVLKYRAI